MRASNPSTWEVEAKGSGQVYPQLNNEFGASLGYTRLCSKANGYINKYFKVSVTDGDEKWEGNEQFLDETLSSAP